MKEKSSQVVVIGSGIGGSVAAALFASHGFPVTLVEKNPRIGGSCSYYTRDGFTVDIGTHMFSRGDKGPIGLAQWLCGVEKKIEFRQISRLSEARGLGFNIVLPAEKWKLPMFFAKLFYQMRLRPGEIPPAIKLLWKMATISDEECEMNDRRTIEEFIFDYVQNPGLMGFFGFLLGLYFVLPMWRVSAGEALYCYRRMFNDMRLSYPAGGAWRVPGTFVERAEECGAEVIVNDGVRSIGVDNGKVKSVILESGREIEADIVVSTTSAKDTVKMVGHEHFPQEYIKAVNETAGSFIAVQVKVALEKKLLKCGCLVGGVARDRSIDFRRLSVDDFRRIYADVEDGRIPAILPVYAPIPTNFDPSLAPAGTQLITACAVAPTTNVPLKDPPEKWLDALLDALDEMVPGLRNNILWVDRFDVKFTERWIGKTGAPAISTGQVVGQVGGDRLPHRTPVKGLYLAGDCAGARGVGTELAARSAIECFYQIRKELELHLI